jgi:hypothetical protein
LIQWWISTIKKDGRLKTVENGGKGFWLKARSHTEKECKASVTINNYVVGKARATQQLCENDPSVAVQSDDSRHEKDADYKIVCTGIVSVYFSLDNASAFFASSSAFNLS